MFNWALVQTLDADNDRTAVQYAFQNTRSGDETEVRRTHLEAEGAGLGSASCNGINGCNEDGRVTTVLLHMQHASEMLLKAILVQGGVRVMVPPEKTSVGRDQTTGQST